MTPRKNSLQWQDAMCPFALAIRRDVYKVLKSHGQDLDHGRREALAEVAKAVAHFEPGTVTSVPLQPGVGKSTIRNSILRVLCQEFAENSHIADTVGGVVVVIETIKEGHEILEHCNSITPGIARLVESPNAANLKEGCMTGQAAKPSQCPGKKCPDADRCPILTSSQHLNDTPILIITHRRYAFYMEEFGPLAFWVDSEAVRHERQLLLIDEYPSLVEKNELSPGTIYEWMGILADSRKFHSFDSLEGDVWFKLLLKFNQLRKKIPPNTKFQLLSKETLRENYFTEIDELVANVRKNARKPWYAEEFTALLTPVLGDGNAYHHADSGQRLLAPRVRGIHGEGKPATFIFCGTADLIPALAYNRHIRQLKNLFRVDGSRLTLHIQRGEAFKFTKSATESKKNREGTLAWTELRLREMQAQHKQALVVTYQKQADRFWTALAPKFPDFVVPFQERDGSESTRVPYFGGMNGANVYGSCTAMVIAGLHRFRTQDYLAEAVAVASVSEEWASMLADAGNDATSLIVRMQDILLANDLVQAIFRTDMRNHGSDKPVDVWLLQPPNDVIRYLQEAFPGCQVVTESDFPPEVILASAESRRYRSEKPRFTKLLPVLYGLEPGMTTTPKEVYTRAGLTFEEFKQAKRNKQVKAFFADHIIKDTTGGTTVYHIVQQKGS